MVRCAEKLADKFPFVRVDFYSIKGRTVFGEMTFYHADAKLDFYPVEYNKIIGHYLHLPPIPEGQRYVTQYP